MAETRIADVIVPEVFNPYVVERTRELSALFASGIVADNPELNRLAEAGGTLINMPFWNDLSGDSEVLSDSAALTVNNITSGKDIARLQMRGKAWGANDLAKALSGDDPMRGIGDLVAGYWAREMQKNLVASLKGVFASTTMASEHVNNIAGEVTTTDAAKLISADAVIDTFGLLGDAMESLTAIAMHSKVYQRLQKLNNIEFVEDSDSKIRIPTYLGRRVIVDDGLPVVAGTTSGFKYTTVLFGAGAFGYGEGGAPVPTEVDRNSLAGYDVLINRKHFVLHPRGVKWTETSVAGEAPTDAELATAANWGRVYDKKNVRLAALITNG